MTEKWISTDDLPGWGDYGRVELRRADGTIETGELSIDAWFTGEDEVPVASIVADDGRKLDLFSFKEWRHVEGD